MNNIEYLRKYKNYNDEHIKKWEEEGEEVEIFNGTLDDYINNVIIPENGGHLSLDLLDYINRDKLKYDLINKYGVEIYDTFIVLNASSF